MPIFDPILVVPQGIVGALYSFLSNMRRVVQTIVDLFNQNEDAWIVPLLENGWQHYGDVYQPFGYRKDFAGVVHFTGVIKSGTPTSTIFTLPADYRPLYNLQFPVIANGAIGLVTIKHTGEVEAGTGCSGTATSLDGISFRP